MDKLSYAWGVAMANQLKAMGVENPDLDVFFAGFEDVYKGKQLALSEEESRELINHYLMELQEKATRHAEEMGKKFLEDNKDREGIHITSTGLQYLIEKEGTGKQPKATDNVTVHYTGRLINGKVFDSSVDRGEPATFPLNRVIPGWTEGLQLMKEGAKYVFFIPAELAYGAHGAGNDIPPHSTLIFEVELIKVG